MWPPRAFMRMGTRVAESFSELGTLFPELEEFKGGLSGRDAQRLAGTAKMGRLRVLHLTQLISRFGSCHLTSAHMGAVLRAIFTAAPNVEDLSISHGSKVSRSERARFTHSSASVACAIRLRCVGDSIERVGASYD